MALIGFFKVVYSPAVLYLIAVYVLSLKASEQIFKAQILTENVCTPLLPFYSYDLLVNIMLLPLKL